MSDDDRYRGQYKPDLAGGYRPTVPSGEPYRLNPIGPDTFIVSGDTGVAPPPFEHDDERATRISTAAAFLESIGEASSGVTPYLKDRARAAAAALRWAENPEEPDPVQSIFSPAGER